MSVSVGSGTTATAMPASIRLTRLGRLQAWRPRTAARGGGSRDDSQGGEPRPVARGTEEAPGEGEGVHPDARPAEPGAARATLGARRQALQLRGRARAADTRRPLRG